MQEQELFNSYEVKNWDFSPRIYKIIVGSAIFNIVALLVFAQSNLLTTKGCDSPLVNKVCTVLDTLVVGGNALSASVEKGDHPYDPTVLTEDDEIVFVNVADKLSYPAGYFALSNPELYAQPNATDPNNLTTNFGGTSTFIPGIQNQNPTTITPTTPNPTYNGGGKVGGYKSGGNSSVLSKAPKYPKPAKTTNNLPDGFDDNNPTVADNKTPKPTPAPTPEVSKTPMTSEPVKDIVINKKPLKDVGGEIRDKVKNNEIDLSKNFSVEARGVLTKDGKLDVSKDSKTDKPKSGFGRTQGDPAMIEVARKAFEAIGDSGWLGYLRRQGIDKFNFTIVQNDEQFSVIITSDLPSPERASTVASGLGGVIKAPLLLESNGLAKLGDDERLLLSNAKTSANGKQFVLNFTLPKQVAMELITRKLNEPEKPEEKPNSTAQIIENSQKTGK